jgi:hypothetical protein
MKNAINLFLLLCCSISFCQNQKLKTTALNTKELENKTYIGFDGLGSNYYINNNVFSKQNENQIWEYKNVALGKITSVDYVNPLKIVLFYGDFNSIIILDNQLNEIQKLNLFDIDNTILASKIGMASQNKLWIYNALKQQIMLFDYLKNTSKIIGNPIQENIKYTQSDFNNFYIDLSGQLRALEKEENESKNKKERIFQIDICPTCLQDVPQNHKHNILNETENKLGEIK